MTFVSSDDIRQNLETDTAVGPRQVHDLNHVWLSRNVSVVSQEPTLFARSVRRNIIYGLEGSPDEPTQAEIEEAAKLANADSFIEVSWMLLQ